MNVAIFCHHSESPINDAVQQKLELQRQCSLLESYAVQQGWSVEHCFFHTGNFDFKHPDDVLLHLLQYAQADEFELVLVEHMGLFPTNHPNQIPPIQLFFVNEDVKVSIGSSNCPIFQEMPPLPSNTFVYRGASQSNGLGLDLK